MGLFANLGQNLPLPTRILIAASDWMKGQWFWLMIVSAIIFFLLKRESKTKIEKNAISRLKLRLPVFGELIRKSELARFSRTLEILIRSGIKILKAIEVAIPILSNELIKEHLEATRGELEQGGSFGKSLRKSPVFPAFMTSLVIVGEESGRLDESLGEVATAYERDIDELLKTMTALLEPALILIMGLIVGFMVVAMLLPIFEINMMVG
jgi:type II secretory pathway component PulF